MRVLPFVALATLCACKHDSGAGDDAATHDAPPGAIDAPSGDSGLPLCTPVQGTPALGLQTVASGLTTPVFVTSPPNDPRLFVLEKSTGAIKIVKNGSVLPTPFLTIAVGSSSNLQDERGLLGLAFAPDYATSGKLYVFFVNPASDEEIDQFTVSADPDVADPSSVQQVIVVDDFASNHNGGTIAFGPDGYLYFAIGDGGNANDVPNNAQNLDVLFGKLSRIDVSSLPYTSPSSNPFFGAVPGADEVWAYGLRNPYRWSFDRQTNDIYIGDVGQGTYEEIDVQPHDSAGGENYGWHVMEGNHCFNPSSGCDMSGKTMPVYEFDHSGGDCAVMGGAVYRGCAMPGYAGQYFFADYCGGWVKSFAWDGNGIGAVTDWPALGPGGDIVAIGQDAQGELYIVRQDTGIVQKIVPM